MKLAIWVAGVTAVSTLVMPAMADVRPSVAAISKGGVKLAALQRSSESNIKASQGRKGVDGKPKNGHPDDPSRPHPERVSP
jgi:hypothetical protein